MSLKDFLQGPISKDSTQQRTFDYKLGKVTLNFSLRVDIKSELSDFRRLLLEALKDVEEELTKHK